MKTWTSASSSLYFLLSTSHHGYHHFSYVSSSFLVPSFHNPLLSGALYFSVPQSDGMVKIVASSLEEDVYPPLPSPLSPSLLEYPLRSSSWSPFESRYSSVSESLECSLEDDEDGSSGGPPAPIPISPGSSLLNELYPLGMYLTPSACVSCDLSRR